MQDQISATSLAISALQKIVSVDPNHQLVKDMTEGSDEDLIKKFWDKPEDPNKLPGSMVTMRVETNYFLAVKKVLKEEYNIEI